ncbi:GNAT family N-acetyltransferase [Humibacter sp. RRB41]|uniref:GNAT family N-acetyltransferase n=1 Tax=Humibacter sp. RRB41 TaxID=2919946 RepID=UPI0035AF376D
MPSEAEVRELYRAASVEPPLSEPESVADLFARLYAFALSSEDLSAVTAMEHGRLVAFAYGHPWSWSEQQDAWSAQLRERLGVVSQTLEGTHVLSLLARHPDATGTRLGARVLNAWLAGIDNSCVWLQTSDMKTPALRLYEQLGFVAIGHGPDAPNGMPGLVLYREAAARRAIGLRASMCDNLGRAAGVTIRDRARAPGRAQRKPTRGWIVRPPRTSRSGR